ncbi:MAG: hypothetical protein ACJ8GW_12230 [Massilia sp.]
MMQREIQAQGAGGVVRTEGKLQTFANGLVGRWSFAGDPTGVIYLRRAEGEEEVTLTYGARRAPPDGFVGMTVAAEPPMAHGTWPRFASPCALANGVDIAFDQSDLTNRDGTDDTERAKFKGTIRRDGMRIKYSMLVLDDAASKTIGSSVQGSLEYRPPAGSGELLKTDVQGWHVYRGQKYLKSLPSGRAIALADVLKQSDIAVGVSAAKK